MVPGTARLETICLEFIRLPPGAEVSSSLTPCITVLVVVRFLLTCQVNASIRSPSAQDGGAGNEVVAVVHRRGPGPGFPGSQVDYPHLAEALRAVAGREVQQGHGQELAVGRNRETLHVVAIGQRWRPQFGQKPGLAAGGNAQAEETVLRLAVGPPFGGADEESTVIRVGGDVQDGGHGIGQHLRPAGYPATGGVTDHHLGLQRRPRAAVGEDASEVEARYGGRCHRRGSGRPAGYQGRHRDDRDHSGRGRKRDQAQLPALPGCGRAERAQVLPLNCVRDALQLFAQQFLDAGHASSLLRGAGREDAGQGVQAAGGGGPDGARADVQRGRHVGHAHVQVVAQGEHLALSPWQRAEGVHKLGALLEGVLHHVLGGGQVTDHQHGQPDQLQLVRLEQLGHLLCEFRGHLGHGATVVPARPRARTADDIRRIGFHTLETRSRSGALRGDTNTTTAAACSP